MVREIPLTKGYVALVDDEEFDWLNRWKWHVGLSRFGNVQDVRRVCFPSPLTRSLVRLSHLVLPPVDGLFPDHIDGDPLNNQRHNLRLATRQQNNWNAGVRRDNSTGFKGVSRRGQRFTATIKVDGRAIHLGTFDTAQVAAQVYDAAAANHFGGFAWLNFPHDALDVVDTVGVALTQIAA